MNEARIKCICNSYRIPDLGIKLLRDEVAWIPENQARSSKDLQRAIQIKAVSVQWVKRCEKVQDPPRVIPPYLANYKPVPKPEPTIISKEDIVVLVREQLEVVLAEMLGPVMELIQRMGGDFVEQARVTNQQLAEIARLLQERPGVVVPKSKFSDSEDSSPGAIFIPTNLVPNVSGNVSVEVQEGSGDALEESLKQLRAQKRKQKDGE